MYSDCCLNQMVQSQLGFQICEVDFSSSCHKCHFWAIFVVSTIQISKTLSSFAVHHTNSMQYSFFFHESKFWFCKFFIEILEKCLAKKFLTLLIIIIIIIIVNVNLFNVDKKWFHIIQKKKLIKVSQERGKVIYFYKRMNINIFLKFKILSKFQESSRGKVTKTYFMNICFA